MLINESESIENCVKSAGMLSNETVIEQHPWVNDVELELSRLRAESEQSDEQAKDYFGTFNAEKQIDDDSVE